MFLISFFVTSIYKYVHFIYKYAHLNTFNYINRFITTKFNSNVQINTFINEMNMFINRITKKEIRNI